MPENTKLKVHKDISSRFTRPYWHIEVYREPKFPSDQYRTSLIGEHNKDEVHEMDLVQYPCGYCKSQDPKLIWIKISMTNAGGTKSYEFKCEKCGIYTFYDEQEFS